MEWNASLLIVVLPFVVALLCVALVHPTMVRIARMKEIVDVPNARKLQRIPIPILGGSCVFLGIVAGIGCASFLTDCEELFIVVPALTVMLYIGTGDDILGLSPRLRLLVELLTMLYLIGIGPFVIDDFYGLWGIDVLPAGVAWPLSLVASVGIINAINLIDGVDGLSSGFCIMACILFGVMFYGAGDHAMAVLAAVSAGALLPFFFHNVFGRTSKMFIGDGGTLVLGVVMSVFVMRLLQRQTPCAVFVGQGVGLVPFALAVLAVPVFDTLRVMTARMAGGHSPFRPDKTHLHHLFIGLGFSHAGTTAVVLGLNILVLLAWWIAWLAGATINFQMYVVLVMGIAVTSGVYYGLHHLRPRQRLYRLLHRWGHWTHGERTGMVLWLQRVMDRM